MLTEPMARSIQTASSAQPLKPSLLPTRACARSDLRLPVMGVGCWAFGGGDYWGPQSQQDVDAVVHCAVEQGCNFFDTAELYNNGGSEASLGLALKGIPRDRVLIGTKINPSNTEPQTLVAHCEASLQRLRTDYVDLYMVHWPITPHSIRHFTTEPMAAPSVTEAFATLRQLQRAGKIRYLGVSNFGPAKLDEALATGAEIVINELPYSLLTRAIELNILPHCQERGVGVLGYMSLLQGILADTFTTLEEIPVLRRRTRHFNSARTPLCRHGLPGAEAETLAALKAIRAIAQRNGLTLSEVALKWAIARDGITSSLCGSRNVRQLEWNLQAAATPLAPELIAELNEATRPLLETLGPSFDYWENPANDRTL